jgi:hypothetical protein
MIILVPVEKDTGKPKYFSMGELCQIDHNSCQIWHNSCQIDHNSCQIWQESGQICQESGQICQKKPLEPPPSGNSESPQSIQSLHSSLSSQSDIIEREKNVDKEFEDWLTMKASQLPQPPTLLKLWIAEQKKKPEIRDQFQAEQTRKAIASPKNLPIEKTSDLSVEEYNARIWQRQQDSKT